MCPKWAQAVDNTARIWDAATGNEILREDGTRSAAFSPEGTRIVTASEDNTARVWDVHIATMSTQDLFVETCTHRLACLSKLSRDEMRLAGYADDQPEIDVCAGFR
jgi:WD40 repeat protein